MFKTSKRLTLCLSSVFLVGLLCTTSARAQDSAWSPGTPRKVADWTSTALVGINVGADAIHSFRNHCGKEFLFRTGFTVGIAELTKLLVHRERPDHSDNKSFFSEHTALAVSSSGYRLSFGIPISFGAGYLRIAAAKHFDTDVLAGTGVGLLSSHVFKCEQ